MVSHTWEWCFAVPRHGYAPQSSSPCPHFPTKRDHVLYVLFFVPHSRTMRPWFFGEVIIHLVWLHPGNHPHCTWKSAALVALNTSDHVLEPELIKNHQVGLLAPSHPSVWFACHRKDILYTASSLARQGTCWLNLSEQLRLILPCLVGWYQPLCQFVGDTDAVASTINCSHLCIYIYYIHLYNPIYGCIPSYM